MKQSSFLTCITCNTFNACKTFNTCNTCNTFLLLYHVLYYKLQNANMLLLGQLQNYYDVRDMFHIQHAELTGWGQIVGEGVDRTGCLVLEEDGVICGCIMVWEWLQNNTEDSISPFPKAWTFDPFLSLTHSSSLLSRLVLHICFKIDE